MNRTELPEVYEADLDAEAFDALAADLTPIIAVALLRESDQPVPLKRALRELRAHRTRGVRIRYRHEGQLWLDTLMPSDAGICRLVRIRETMS